MSNKEKYSFIKLLEIRFADPISSIKLTKNFVVMGTMMGRVTLYNISEQKTVVLSELNSENVSDIAYDDEEKVFYVGIGDDEIKKFEINNITYDTIPQNQSINVYDTDMEHTKYCENAFIFLSPDCLFRIQLCQIEEGNTKIINVESEYQIRYFKKNDSKKNLAETVNGTISTTNYSVPLDFDGKRYLFVEFHSSTDRSICVANVPSITPNDKVYKYDLDNKIIGHISHAKLLKDDKVFIVHSLNKCEIRNLDDQFSLVESFKHIGEEVYGVDIIYFSEDEECNVLKVSTNTKNLKALKNDMGTAGENEDDEKDTNNRKNAINQEILPIRYPKMYKELKKIEKKSDEVDTNTVGYLGKNRMKNNKNNDKNLSIITMDIDGNINLYESGSEIKLFNLYELSSIPKDYKEKQFFSMGYAYYIKSNLSYFCISSDHGCFIIKYDEI